MTVKITKVAVEQSAPPFEAIVTMALPDGATREFTIEGAGSLDHAALLALEAYREEVSPLLASIDAAIEHYKHLKGPHRHRARYIHA